MKHSFPKSFVVVVSVVLIFFGYEVWYHAQIKCEIETSLYLLKFDQIQSAFSTEDKGACILLKGSIFYPQIGHEGGCIDDATSSSCFDWKNDGFFGV